jgi:hypothetical protein
MLLVLMGAGACSKGKPSAEGGSPSPASPGAEKAGFKVVAVQAVDAGDRPQAKDKANQVAAQVADLFNSYYTVAFLDPSKWANGQHTGLADLFTGDVKGQVGSQLQGLALGDLAPKITSVKPTREEVHVKVFVDDGDMGAPVVAVNTFFEATAEAKSRADGTVKISHTMKTLLASDGGGYKIAGGTADLTADTSAGAMGPAGHRTVSLGTPSMLPMSAQWGAGR